MQFRPLSVVLRKRSFAGDVAEAEMLKAAGCMAVSLRWRSEQASEPAEVQAANGMKCYFRPNRFSSLPLLCIHTDSERSLLASAFAHTGHVM
jgi:hypothetical protein